MSQGERLLLFRAAIRARFPILPVDCHIRPDVPSGPNVRFIELGPAGVPDFEAAATFVIDWLRAAHEHGHELEAQLVRALTAAMGTEARAKDYVRERLYTWRRIPGSWQEAERYANTLGEQGRQAFHPVEVVAESVAFALGAVDRERTIAEAYPVTQPAQLEWWQAMMRAAGCTLPALKYIPSRDFTPGRFLPIRYIVLHTTQGYNSISTLTRGGVSAHYLERDDDEYQLVDEGSTAWHAGAIVGTPTTPLYTGHFLGFDSNGQAVWSVNPNDESIGIEMEGFAASDVSPTIIARTADRINTIRSIRGPLPIVSHAELSPGNRSDPGAQNRAAVEALLGEEVLDMAITKEELRQIVREEVERGVETTGVTIASAVGRTFNHKLRRLARYLKGLPRDPGGVGGNDTTGYGAEDDTPLG